MDIWEVKIYKGLFEQKYINILNIKQKKNQKQVKMKKMM